MQVAHDTFLWKFLEKKHRLSKIFDIITNKDINTNIRYYKPSKYSILPQTALSAFSILFIFLFTKKKKKWRRRMLSAIQETKNPKESEALVIYSTEPESL